MTESTEVMENKLLELEGKLRTLKVTVNKSDQVSETGNLEVITRHEALITTKIENSSRRNLKTKYKRGSKTSKNS